MEGGDIMRNSLINKIKRWSAVGVAGVVAAVAMMAGIYSPMASAHGEKSQPAFMRMRTIQWYDLKWSTDKLKVNDEMTVTGKLHVFEGWPETVDKPEVAFLNIGIPGPVFVRTESYLGDGKDMKLAQRSVSLEVGRSYEFKVVLKARRPGRWHVHTMMNVEGGGPIIGPGKWAEIEGAMSDFKNPITTLTGQTIDIETYGLGGIVRWHLFWYIVGIAWMWWWFRRPTLLPRWNRVTAGQEEGLITDTDKKAGIAFAAATVLIVLFGYTSANSQYPIAIPLQAGVLGYMTPLPKDESVIVAVERAEYRVPGRQMSMALRVTNNSDAPIQLGEFMCGSIRFMNEPVMKDESNYPENILAEEGLEVEDNNPIQPGETRTIKATATDAAWENERMSDLIYDPDSRFGGMLQFIGAGGRKHSVSIGAPIIPVFG
jgi:methane/ammonia monooxygenase subunit B